MRGITRAFPGALALDDVSFDLYSGEVHALVGENGAGKSTLINVLSGVLRPDRGTITVDGKIARLSSPLACRRLGIATVHQEAEHFRDLSVAENMALLHGLPLGGWGQVDWRQIQESARQAVSQLGEPIDVRRQAGQLSIVQLQMTHVAAAVLQRARIVVLDEPTSALSDAESEWLFGQIDRLQADGAGVIYISHRHEEIFRLADRITVLRDGQRVWCGATAETDRQELVQAMVGRHVEPLNKRRQRSFLKNQPTGATTPRLSVSELVDRSGRVRGVNLTVLAGEIVGIYGLVGAGRSEFAQAVFGCRPIESGEILIDGVAQKVASPRDAVAAGIAYVPEDRLRQALFRDLSVRANTVMASLARWMHGLLVVAGSERKAAQQMVERMSVQHSSLDQAIGELSGGNQQKIVLARWMLTNPRVLMLDEPTRGVDVGAKSEIHGLLAELANQGCAIVMISSELPEVLQHADRVVVFRQGCVSGVFDAAETSATEIAAAALPEEEVTRRRAVAGERGRFRRAGKIRHYLRSELALGLAVVALSLWTAGTTEGFSIISLLANTSLWAILGMAAAVVILAGGIDISLGSLVALSAAMAALVLQLPGPPGVIIPLGIASGVLVGGLGGLVNAAIALTGRIHPIVVTLGTMTIYRGAVIALLGGKAIVGLPPGFLRLARDQATGFRGSIVVAVCSVLFIGMWLTFTRSGRHIYAVGSGPNAARLAGITQTRTWLVAFATGGMLAGLAGVLQLAESGQMQSRLGVGWELHAIAVAVIGGVAITGGRGTVLGVVLSATLIRLINGALVRWGIRDVQFDLFVGAMILAAVLLDLAWRKLGDSG
jgi:rhamnose transport system ATP-binding protein